MRVSACFAVVVLVASLAGCGDDAMGGPRDAGPALDARVADAAPRGDAGMAADGAMASDGAVLPDSGSSYDSGASPDSGTPTSDGGTASRYSTDFGATEMPISEGGAWVHTGLDWTLVETAGGIAYGTQTGSGGYDDSYAYLAGFAPDQSASAVIHRDAVIDTGCTHEVEILLRWSDAAHTARGYECNLAYDGSYAQIVRWNGPLGDFTYIGSGTVPGGVHDGDTLSGSIVGNLITLSVNGVEIARATDATFATGNPGIGFWRGGACGTRGDYGFTSFTAR